jgi:predicted transcriptional regulator
MLTTEHLAILREIDNSVAFDGDDRSQVNFLVVEGYVEKDGDLYRLTAKGEKALLDNAAGLTEI